MQVNLGAGRTPAKFKLMLKPKMSSEGRGGASFKKAKGKCFLELKCEEGQDVIGKTHFCIWVGDQPPRGPVQHNFSEDVVGRLPRDNEIWDLKKVPEGSLVFGVDIWVFSEHRPAPCA